MNQARKTQKNITPFVAVAGILLIVLGVMVRPVMYFTALFAAAMMLILKPKECIMLLFTWINFSVIFKIPGVTISVFTMVEILFVARMFFIKKQVNTQFLISWILISFYLLIGVGNEFATFIKILIIPVLFYFMALEIKYDDLQPLTYYYTLGVLASSIIGLLKRYIPNMDSTIGYKVFNYQYHFLGGWLSRFRFSGLWNDPNYYSIHALLVCAVFIVLLVRRKIKPLTFAIVTVSAVLFGALSCSKAYLVVLCFVAVSFIVILFAKKRYSLAIIGTVLIAIFVALILSGKVPAFNSMLERISITDTTTVNGITTNRMDKVVLYFTEFFNNPIKFIFGNGLGKSFTFIIPHNTLIDYLDVFGIVGTVLFTISIVRAAKYGFKSKITKHGNALPLIVILIMYLSLSMIYAIDLVFELFIAVGYLVLVPKAPETSLPDNERKLQND